MYNNTVLFLPLTLVFHPGQATGQRRELQHAPCLSHTAQQDTATTTGRKSILTVTASKRNKKTKNLQSVSTFQVQGPWPPR